MDHAPKQILCLNMVWHYRFQYILAIFFLGLSICIFKGSGRICGCLILLVHLQNLQTLTNKCYWRFATNNADSEQQNCWHCENLERFLFEVLSTTEFEEICTAPRNKTSPKFNSHLTMLIYHFKTFTNQYLLITCWRLQIKGNSLKWLVIFCC